MLTFDEFGQLTPDQPIESELSEVENVSVFNERRRLIFSALVGFLDLVKSWEIGHFQVWLDGSFVTKKELPRDVDCVLFLSHQAFYEKQTIIQATRSAYKPTVDSYFIPVFPELHPQFILYNSDRIDWLFLFSKDRQKRKKGFIQLDF